MTDKIEPALTTEEWANVQRFGVGLLAIEVLVAEDEPQKAVAIANAALPDSDSRKITRERVAAIREAADELESNLKNPHWRMDDDRSWAAYNVRLCREMADALESYLPPANP